MLPALLYLLLVDAMATTDYGSLLQTAFAATSVLSLAGLGLQRARLADNKEQLKESREEVAALRASREEDRKDWARDKAQLDDLKGKVAVLESVVTGEVHWQAIEDLLGAHHEEAVAFWSRGDATLEAILSELQKRPQK